MVLLHAFAAARAGDGRTEPLESLMIVDLAMLAMARVALRLQSPLRAHALLCRLGGWLPEIETAQDARVATDSLRGFGSCLSRSLAVAARAPKANVVIGVAPGDRAPLFAHAWIEMDGAPIDPGDVAGTVIARMSGRSSGG